MIAPLIAPLIAPDGLNYQVESTITFGLTGRCLPDCTSDCTGWPLITTLIISQVEHHLWPDLSMLSYQKAAPLVQSICRKHGVPYIKHSVFWRLKKTIDIMVGKASMRKFPSKWEVEADLTSADDVAPLHATAH